MMTCSQWRNVATWRPRLYGAHRPLKVAKLLYIIIQRILALTMKLFITIQFQLEVVVLGLTKTQKKV